MREDMAKVLVERPRRGGGGERPGRPPRSLDDLPRRLKMAPGGGRTKWLNENLRPLERFLESQVGRPWDKVYSEICQRIDGRHTVQQHILLHLDDFVAMHVRITGQGVEVLRWRDWVPLADTRRRLYVDPRTGLLRADRARSRRRIMQATGSTAADASRRILGALEQLHRIDGVWYHIGLAVLPEPAWQASGATSKPSYPTRWDVVRKAYVSRLHADHGPGNVPGNQSAFGCGNVYAHSKRQLGKHELERYGLKD